MMEEYSKIKVSFGPELTDLHMKLYEVMESHGKEQTSASMMCLLSQIVGEVMALSSDETLTPGLVFIMVMENVAEGNRRMRRSLLMDTEGNA